MFYTTLNTSKQAIHQMLERRMSYNEEVGYLKQIVWDIRQDHPTLSSRAMYHMIMPENIGRDKFEGLCRVWGYNSERIINHQKTTNSNGVIRFENHLAGLVLTDVNQAFSSDITYFDVGGRFYYITFIMDCFSRMILGHSVSKRLTTEQTTMPALQMAIKTRGRILPPGMVFHSDGGGQYYAKEFVSITTKYKLVNSMCEYPWENGKAERINGTIKNNYLKHLDIKTFEELVESVDHTVSLYNKERPHKSLNYLTPFAFEKKTNFSAANKEEDNRMICHNLQEKRTSTTPLNGQTTLHNQYGISEIREEIKE